MLQMFVWCDVLGDGTSSQVPMPVSAEICRPPISETVLRISTTASLQVAAQSMALASFATTSVETLPPATTSATLQQSVAGSSSLQPVVSTISEFVHVEYGAGDSNHVSADVAASVKPLTGSRGDSHTLVGADSKTSSGISSSMLQSQSTVTSSSESVVSGESAVQPIAASASLAPKSLLTTGVEAHSAKNMAENIVPLSKSIGTAESLALSVGTFSSSTSFSHAGGFTPVFGNISQTVSSVSVSLSTVAQPPTFQIVSTTSTAAQQPAVSVLSNASSFGAFANQPSFSSSTAASNQPAATAPAVVQSSSASGTADARPLSSQPVSSAFSLSFKAAATTAFTSSTSLNSSNTSSQLGATQPMFGSVADRTSSSVSSAAGFTPSVVPFGNSQQPAFRPVFGNSDSQQAASGFASFSNSPAVPGFGIQPSTVTATQASTSNVFQTSGNQPHSNSVGSFTGVPSSANPFGSSVFQSGSSIFGNSASNSQTTSSSFGSFTAVSTGGPFGSSTMPSGFSTVPKTNPVTASDSFGALSSGVHTFGSSNLQTGSSIFGSSVSKSDVQANSGSLGGFTGTGSFAFGNSSIQQGSVAFGASSGPVFNGIPSVSSSAEQSLPNGFHKSTASANLFAFSGKNDQTPSRAASPFSFGQSTNTANGFPMPTPVPNFGSSTPASSFTFGKPACYCHLHVNITCTQLERDSARKSHTCFTANVNFVILNIVRVRETDNALLCYPLTSDRQQLSCDVCLEVRGEIIRTVLCCIMY